MILVCVNEHFEEIIKYVKIAYNVILIAVPIVLLVIGSVDLLKAVSSGDEKAIKAATSMLGKRAAAAVGVFLLIIVVRLLTGIVGGDQWRECWNDKSGYQEEAEVPDSETDD